MFKTLGIRAHDYGKLNSRTLSCSIMNDGFGSAQLALNKAIAGIESIADVMPDELLEHIEQDFKRSGVVISVLGCYLNYAHPDRTVRQNNIGVFKSHIQYAKKLNAKLVGTETGSMMPDYSYTPYNHSDEAYRVFAKSLAELLRTAEDHGVDIAVEGVWNHIIFSNEQMETLIKDMASKRLKVILDPVNLLNINNYRECNDLTSQAFDLFGDRIQVVHIKDFQPDGERILEVSHGDGINSFDHLLGVIDQSECDVDVLLENADVTNIENIKKLFDR